MNKSRIKLTVVGTTIGLISMLAVPSFAEHRSWSMSYILFQQKNTAFHELSLPFGTSYHWDMQDTTFADFVTNYTITYWNEVDCGWFGNWSPLDMTANPTGTTHVAHKTHNQCGDPD